MTYRYRYRNRAEYMRWYRAKRKENAGKPLGADPDRGTPWAGFPLLHPDKVRAQKRKDMQ